MNEIENLQKVLPDVEEVARGAGDILVSHFERSLAVDFKKDGSFVTEVDTQTERYIKNKLVETFPDSAFLGEESGLSDETAPWRWVVDPLDGTANYVNGIPIFAVSIALQYRGDTRLAVVHNPVTRSLFSAVREGGAWWNRQRISVSRDKGDNIVATIAKSRKAEDARRVPRLMLALQEYGYRVRILGSAALELAYLARGGTDIFINLGTQAWDFEAGLLIAREAGARVTTLSGEEWRGERYFIASNGLVHAAAVRAVNEK